MCHLHSSIVSLRIKECQIGQIQCFSSDCVERQQIELFSSHVYCICNMAPKYVHILNKMQNQETHFRLHSWRQTVLTKRCVIALNQYAQNGQAVSTISEHILLYTPLPKRSTILISHSVFSSKNLESLAASFQNIHSECHISIYFAVINLETSNHCSTMRSQAKNHLHDLCQRRGSDVPTVTDCY